MFVELTDIPGLLFALLTDTQKHTHMHGQINKQMFSKHGIRLRCIFKCIGITLTVSWQADPSVRQIGRQTDRCHSPPLQQKYDIETL